MITLGTLTRALATSLADALAPPACAACDARLDQRTVLCASCAAAVERAPPSSVAGVRDVVAFACFGGPIANAVRRLKYGDRPDLAGPLGHLVRRAARDASLRADLVVPVPLHPVRLAERGYNQATLLAASAAEELGVALRARALARTRHTPQQARLERARRLENVAGAFRVRDPAVVRGGRIVLVDDVATTGATLAACAHALRAVGAASVTALVLARADREADGEEE